MKKQILKAFLVLAVLSSASTAMAVTSIVATITIGAGNTFSPSTKVGLSITSIATSYTAGSCHLNGTKEYATVGGSNLTVNGYNDPSKIYTKDITTQATDNIYCVPTSQTSALALQDTTWK